MRDNSRSPILVTRKNAERSGAQPRESVARPAAHVRPPTPLGSAQSGRANGIERRVDVSAEPHDLGITKHVASWGRNRFLSKVEELSASV